MPKKSLRNNILKQPQTEVLVKHQKCIALALFLIMLAVVFTLSAGSRYEQKKKGWYAYPEQYYYEDIPAVNTLDAYKWVRHAEEFKNGTYVSGGKDPLMYYPDGYVNVAPAPMLSVMLAYVSNLVDGNMYKAGMLLIPILSALFIIPFGLYFYRLGYPLAGIAGAFLGVFGTTYYIRSTLARIDTDSMNLFFPFLCALFILISAESKNRRNMFIFAAMAGLTQALWCWWYNHPAFILVFGATLATTLFFYKYTIKDILKAGVVYLIFSNPIYIKDAFINIIGITKAYFIDNEAKGGFPNVYQTVSEATKTPASEILQTLFINPVFIAFACIILLLMIAKLNKRLIPLAPVFALGLMTFHSSIRFSIYLMPFIGATYGFLINYTVNLLKSGPFKNYSLRSILGYTLCGALLAVFIMLGAPLKGLTFYYTPKPSIDSVTMSTFDLLKQRLPKDSVIYTWWDYGLAIEAVAGMATFHDGMMQNTPKTWIIARSFLKDEATLHNNIAYISNEGMDEILKGTAQQALTTIDEYNKPLINNNIYLSFTEDMIDKFSPISYIGSWDILNGKPGESLALAEFMCVNTASPELNCMNKSGSIIKVNLALGLFNDKIPAKQITYVDALSGTVKKINTTGFQSDWHLVVMQRSGEISYMVYLMSDKAYNSSFAQLFILGNYDPELFEQVIYEQVEYNYQPQLSVLRTVSRVFHVKQGAE